jgi:uncharacterized protein (TIGR01777 family)
MKILVTGSSGLVGSALVSHLAAHGDIVLCLVRRAQSNRPDEIVWDPASGKLDRDRLEGIDAVVHLAGESIASGRWSAARKQRILESRTKGTRLLAGSLAALHNPPQVMISASAVGIYGDRGNEVLTEESGSGSGFLADVCRQWELEAMALKEGPIRLVLLRMGMILSSEGGALARMLPPFRFGVGGRLGSGKQYVSWIALDDLLDVIRFAIASPSLHGAVNAVAPAPVTNQEFTRALGIVLKRPTLFSVPAFAVRILFGEMGRELLLSSNRVMPGRLLAAGFRFRFPEIEVALRHAISRKRMEPRV